MRTLITISADVADDINLENLVCRSDGKGGVCITAPTADIEISNSKIVKVGVDVVDCWLKTQQLPCSKITPKEMESIYRQFGKYFPATEIPRPDLGGILRTIYGNCVSLESWVKSWIDERCAYLNGGDEKLIRKTALWDVFYDMKPDVEDGPYDDHIIDDHCHSFDDWYEDVFFRRVSPLLALQGFDTSDEDNEELRDAIILWARNMYPLVDDEEHTEYIDAANHRTFIYNKVSDSSILVEK